MTIDRKTTESIVRKLSKKDLFIEAAFVAKVLSQIPDGAPPGKVEVLRMTFFSGAFNCLLILRAGDDETVTALLKEVLSFMKEERKRQKALQEDEA